MGQWTTLVMVASLGALCGAPGLAPGRATAEEPKPCVLGATESSSMAPSAPKPPDGDPIPKPTPAPPPPPKVVQPPAPAGPPGVLHPPGPPQVDRSIPPAPGSVR